MAKIVDYKETLLQNVHEDVELPSTNGITTMIRGVYHYYHYGCDGHNDKGWGCGYRTLQTLCSWIKLLKNSSTLVPNIRAIQEILIELEDKPSNFLGSHEWIGSFEACLVIDHLYNIPSKIIHVNRGSELFQHISTFTEHFQKYGSPLMMGGDQDSSSKAIMGIHSKGKDIYFLVVDPHYVGRAKSSQELQENGWVKLAAY
ncbi:hypothetical protein L9F63_005143 [Diploptera punctata]|uniref:UFSP1/2/DUB catalytic domain-containing protein n=1 Tax=Diploptera punctata TaxID=6984 RepID=A0AAD8E628_DIPPU|nr:hypothetical protein L9F63_005143 [Diploptera punctata]